MEIFPGWVQHNKVSSLKAECFLWLVEKEDIQEKCFGSLERKQTYFVSCPWKLYGNELHPGGL